MPKSLSHQLRLLKLFSLILPLFISMPILAETNSRPGGTGMTWMRTADTLDSDELVIYDQVGIDSYVILNSNLTDFDLFNTVGVNYGMFDPLELGFQTTWMSNDQHGTSGIRSYKGIVKLNILGGNPNDKYAVSLSYFQTTAPADVSDKIGTGKIEKGTELNTSYYAGDINMHLTLGMATADAKYYNPDVQYYSVDKQYANFGLEFLLTEKHTLGMEAILESSDDGGFDKNQIFAFSLQYKPKGQWNFDFGAAFGIPEDRSEPAKSFYASFNYHFDHTQTQSLDSETGQKVSKKNKKLPIPKSKQARKPSFNKRPPVKVDTSAPKKKSRKYKYMVRIKNATGSSSTADRVASFLKQNGFGVESIRDISRRTSTEIRYLKQNSKQALRLALKIPGNQDLRVMSGLSKGVDFELVIGSDIVGKIR